jgi:hypothetical protein
MAMPARDCIYCFNLIAAEYGLRSRLGYREWATGLIGATDNTVRTMMGFNGTSANGSADKLFACTQSGIFEATESREAPTTWTLSTAYSVGDYVTNGTRDYVCDVAGTSDVSGGPTGTGTNIADGTARWDYAGETPYRRLIEFSVKTTHAGYGISTILTTPGNRFMLYADEENGLYHYNEDAGTWAIAASGTTQAWESLTTYFIGNKVINGGKEYVCDTDGVSAASGGPTGTGSNIADGTARWDYVGAAVANAIGPSLADQQAGLTLSMANIVFVHVWGSRAWLVEKNSTRGWYMDANAVFGTATSFDFGVKMSKGGHLVGLWSWTYDGGSGMDDSLVAISGSGDVVIFQGSDPSSANTFSAAGSWSVGGVPAGRRIATDRGGDLLILSLLGVIPLSKLVVSKNETGPEAEQYATAKIASLFNQIVSVNRTVWGWGVYTHPTDNALLVAIPKADGEATSQLAMSFSTRGWSQYRDLPLLSAAVWDGDLYFGTQDGRVCINSGYVDNVQLADSDAWTPVGWSVLSAFSNLGNGRQKQIQQIRPTIRSETGKPVYEVTAKYGFDLSEPEPPVGSPAGGSNAWGSGVWDTAVWGGDGTPSQRMCGASGMGRDVAIAVRGAASSRTVLVGVDVFFQQGGLL